MNQQAEFISPENTSDWRKIISARLRERNKLEMSYNDIVTYNNRLFERTNQLKSENLTLSIENEKLRENGGLGALDSTANARKIQSLEKIRLTQQEELTELHKRKGDNSQMIIDLNIKITEMDKHLALKDNSLKEHQSKINSLNAEVQMLNSSLESLKSMNSTVRDEFTSLHLLHCSLEEKLRKTQNENMQLVERLIKYKAKDAEKMNDENESFLKKRNDKMKKDLEEAAREGTRRSTSPMSVHEREIMNDLLQTSLAGGTSAAYFDDDIPNKVYLKFDAHEGEVNAVQWSPVERLVATGGTDRKVKLWDVSKGGSVEPRGTLIGSNQAVNSLAFDSAGSLLLGTSNDFASRVWTISDQRLRHTLTGHSGKVMAAKFLGESQKIVTGSHDRTLKIWDLRSRSCIETKFAGSSCNDLVATDGSGSTIISGHFDKKIRFWDFRSDCSSNDIVLQGKVTSLDLSKDCKYLASCVRDDTIKLIDLRQNQILTSLSHDNFKVGCDFSRIAFSPDNNHICAGAQDGSLFIWNFSGALEIALKDHTVAVQAVHFHPFSSTVLASVDRFKKCIIWTN